jgi:hypothetical protein
MQRFRKGEPILILPKFAHLYPVGSAVVADVKTNPFRSIFNRYTLQFTDRSQENVFQFQIIDDPPGYKTLIALLAFDNHQHTSNVQLRGKTPYRQLLLQAPGYDVDLKIRTADTRASVLGQVLEINTGNFDKPVEVSLLKEGTPVHNVKSDNTGEFKFDSVARGRANILIVIPQHAARVLGEISI